MPRSTETRPFAELRPWLKVLDWRRRRLWQGAGLMLLTVMAAIGLLALSGWFITATAIAVSIERLAADDDRLAARRAAIAESERLRARAA